MTAMHVASLILLTAAGTLGALQFSPRLRGPGPGSHAWLYATAIGQLVVLAAAAVLALGAGGSAGWQLAGPLAVAAAAAGGGAPTLAILQLSFNARHPEHQPLLTGEDGEPVVNREFEAEAQPVLRGGAWIGVLERLAVASTLSLGWPEGLAIILAVKALGRYSELGKSGAAERFILGTFSSQLWACACVGVAVLLS